MSQINFAFTIDNSNVMAAVDQTVKKFEDMGAVLKGIGAGTTFDNIEGALEALRGALSDNEEYIDELTEKLNALAAEQREAALAGDTKKVQETGAKMKELAEDIQAVITETREYSDALKELGKTDGIDHSLASVQGFDQMTEKMTEMSALISELNAKGIDFTDTEQAVGALRESLKEATQQIIEHRAKIDELYEKQKEAVLAGDSEGVAQFGQQIGVVATEMEKLTEDSQRLSEVLSLVRGSMDASALTGFAGEMAGAQAQIKEAQMTLESLAMADSSVDLSTTRGQLSALRDAMDDNEKQIREYEKTLKELESAQQEAFSSGDFAKSEELAQDVLRVADAVQRLREENEQYAQVLETVEWGIGRVNQKNEEKAGIMTRLLGGQEKYNEIMRLLPPELQRVVVGINGVTKASLKFIATPIGAVIAALVLAYKALSTWLNKTSEGQRELAKISGYVSGVFAGLVQVAKKVGETLYKAFTDPVQSVKNLGKSIKDYVIGRFQAVMKAAGGLATALGQLNRGEWKEAGQSFKDAWSSLLEGSIADKVGDTIEGIHQIGKAESDLNLKRDQLRRDRMDWMKEEGELDKQIAEQRNKLYVGSMADRQKASARMMDLINQKYDKQVEFAKREYEIKRDSNALTDSSLEELEQEAALQKQMLEIEASRETAKRMALRVEGMADRSGAQAAEQEREMRERREQLMENLTEMAGDTERDAAALRISAMKDGFAKEQAEIDHEHEVRVAQIKDNYEKQRDAIEKLQRAEWKKSHGGSTAGFVFNENDDAAKKALEVSNAQLENEDRRHEIANEQHLENLVKQYQTFAEKEKEIIRRGNEDIAQLRAEGYNEQADERAKAMEQELTELRSHEKDIYKRLAKDTSKWGIVSIQKAIEDAETELLDLSSTPEKAVANAQAIDNLKRSIENLKQTAKDFSLAGALKMLLTDDKGAEGPQTLAERFDAMRRAWANMSAEDKWKNIGGWTAKIAGGLGKAAAYMKQVAELTGNTGLSDTADKIDALAQNLSAAGQGAAQGGWIGAIVGGALDILNQTVEAFQNVGLQEAIATKNAEDWAHALETAFLTMDEERFDTVFGTKEIALAQENFRVAMEAADGYRKKLRELNEEYSNQNIKKYKNSYLQNDYIVYMEAMEKGYSGLQRMLVKTKEQTGWAKFWGAQDDFTALADLAPELWDENGELVVENARRFLSVNTQISAEQRRQIEQLIELKDGYDDAMRAVDDAISENFGSLAADLTEIIWDSVMTGSDAWEQFEKVGAEAISKLGKQMIQEMMVSEYLEQYRERMRAAYKLGDTGDTQRELRNITADIFAGMQGMLTAGSMVAEEYRQWAAEHGFDLAELSEQSPQTQEAKAGGFQTMSQDTASELNGRFTALQLSNEAISQAAKEGLIQIVAIGGMLSAGGGTLSEIRNLHMLEVGYLEDIAKYTKPLLDFGEKLDKISDNTARL